MRAEPHLRGVVNLNPSSSTLGFEQFAQDRLPSLLRYAAALTDDPEQCRDIVQDVMVRAFRDWQRISAMAYPAAYVKRMVTNEYLSWRRRWSVRNIRPLPDETLHHLAAAEPDPSRTVSARDELRRALARLPRRQRAVLVLHFYEGLTHQECAEVLGIAESTARAFCSRGLAALRLESDSVIAGKERP